MILWACAIITVLSAAIAAFAGDLRRSILALWTAGLAAGAFCV